MGTGFLVQRGGSGGGGGLNFQVVGNPKPKNPVEGTVWVNTDVDITGYFLSAEQPENLSEGNLWIKISDSSSIKVGTPLGKDYITIMLDSVSQYVGGKWVSVEAKSYQGGVWVNWIPADALYWFGYDKTEITGGWMKTYHSQGSGGTFSMNGDSITLKAGSGTAAAQCGCMTKNSINLTGKNTVKVNVTGYSGAPSGNDMGQIMVFSSKGAPFNASTIIAEAYILKDTTGVFSLSVSTVGSAYIAILAYDKGCSFTIDKVWLE